MIVAVAADVAVGGRSVGFGFWGKQLLLIQSAFEDRFHPSKREGLDGEGSFGGRFQPLGAVVLA